MTQNKPKRIKWTDQDVYAAALKYRHRVDFQKHDENLYAIARRRGILDQACSHMVPKPQPYKYSDEHIISIARKYSSIIDFQRNDHSIYECARVRGILELACTHMPRMLKDWTHESVAIEAKKYQTRQEFANHSNGAVKYAKKHGLYDDICAHMELVFTYWTDELILAEAKNYESRHQFQLMSNKAYHAAIRNGILDIACAHMEPGELSSDADVIYIWEAVGEFFDGEKIYKIGITSSRIGGNRIKTVATANKFKHKIIAITYVGEKKALEIEDALLCFGKDPKLDGIGRTEFRALTDQELIFALDYIKHHQIRIAA